MSKKSAKAKPSDNSNSTPAVKENKETYEKSVIKDMESSRLRIKPWVLQVIGGVFILLGLFFVFYPFFADRVSINLPDFLERDNDQVTSEDNDNQDSDNQDKEIDEEDENGNIAGGESNRRDTASTPASIARAERTAEIISQTGVWKATDYVESDITTGTYQVKLGDTLWEVAEAVYGNGAQWNQILEANPSDIGFLPDGSQALIIAGQFLTIP